MACNIPGFDASWRGESAPPRRGGERSPGGRAMIRRTASPKKPAAPGRRIIPGMLAALLGAIAGAGAAEDGGFREEVAPIFRDRCLRCHGGASTKGGLSLATADALRPGGANGAALEARRAGGSP